MEEIMNKDKLNYIFDNLDKIVNLAVQEALEKHQKLGESVVVSQNDAIKIFTGDEIKILLKNDNDQG